MTDEEERDALAELYELAEVEETWDLAFERDFGSVDSGAQA